jgi:FMN phosphatase YigB (HAD superfamily)
MKKYSTLILDAFETLIHIDRGKLFEHRAGQRTIHTTAPRVHEFFEATVGKIDFGLFVEGFLGSSREANRRRKAEMREIPSADRFRIMLQMLGCEPGSDPDLPRRLAETHMGHLAPALTIPESHQAMLDWSRGAGYRLGMISNFDHAPTVHHCLERHAVGELFERVVISDEIGWRKPHPAIFEHTFRTMSVAPSEGLFVGDRLELDVDGANGVGMDAAWIDTGRQQWTDAHARPRFTIRALPDLVAILGDSG